MWISIVKGTVAKQKRVQQSLEIYINSFFSIPLHKLSYFSACSRAINLDWVSLTDFAARRLPKKERSVRDLPNILPAGRQLSPPQWEAANIPSWQTISCSQSLTYHLYLISFRQIQDLFMRIWQRWQRCCGGSGGSPRPQVPQPKTNPRALRDQTTSNCYIGISMLSSWAPGLSN